MKPWMRWMVCGVALSVSAEAHAAANRVLWYNGNGGYTSANTATFTTSMLSAGAAAVDVSSTWPSSFSSYVLVVIAAPSTAFSASQITDLTNFQAGGGLTVLLGDSAPSFSVQNGVVNTIALSMGLSTQISGGAYESGCGWSGQVATSSNPFMSGVSGISYAAAAILSVGSKATKLINRQSPYSDTIVAYENGVIMDADLSIFGASSCNITGNDPFFQNLYTKWCDYDGDGVKKSLCGGTDCNDEDAKVSANSTWYSDADNDSYGVSTTSQVACSQPSGYASKSGDCDDTNKTIYPSATELCDNLDNDCDSSIDDGLAFRNWYIDSDSDGFGDAAYFVNNCNSTAPVGYVITNTDCNDVDAGINPSAKEICDGVDQDCDGTADDSAIDAIPYYKDADGDYYGDATISSLGCSAPGGYVTDKTDCDDSRSSVYPGAPEYCNSRDDDCDKLTDESALDAATWYRDADADSYGTVSSTQSGCSQPTGYVADSTDCNDANGTVHPGASETCNAVDDNCNGTTDENPTDGATWYLDADSDHYGNAAKTSLACSQPTGYVGDATDCNDTVATVNPGASEYCNNVDDNCDGTIDGATAVDRSSWYADLDADTYGNPASAVKSCTAPSGYIADSSDCNDADATISPAALEICDGIDNNCDALVDQGASGAGLWYADADGDGFGDPAVLLQSCDQPAGYTDDATDCDDSRADSYPTAAEIPYDGVDQDCDGADVVDVDGDGYASTLAGGLDCVDTYASVFPGAVETADGVDEDCDHLVDEGTSAADDDGDGYSELGGDCNDADAAIYPGAAEIPDTADQNCDGTVDEGTNLADDDGDGQNELQGDCNDGDSRISGLHTEVIGNGIDDDCDGVVDGGETDADADGYTESGGDCSLDDATVHPGAVEVIDGKDQDCDGQVDEGTTAYDDDGDGVTEEAGDCNDDDASVKPDALEQVDGIDGNCDGRVDEGTDAYDDDGDGFTEEGGDCDDDAAAVYPGAVEQADGADNDCDGALDEGAADLDGDGYSSASGDCDYKNGWANPAVTEVCDGIDNNCDDRTDEGCGNDSEPQINPVKQPEPCGCASGGEASGLGLLALAAVAVGRRKRRLQ